MYFDVIMSGFGGQGIMTIGDILAFVAMKEGREVTWMPSYGVEMRGGSANATIVISDRKIGSPITGAPMSAIVMSRPAMEKFGPRVKAGGLLVANTNMIGDGAEFRDDLVVVPIPANELAQQIVNSRFANMVAFGAFLEKSGVVGFDNTVQALEQTMPANKRDLLEYNIKAMRRGREFALGN